MTKHSKSTYQDSAPISSDQSPVRLNQNEQILSDKLLSEKESQLQQFSSRVLSNLRESRESLIGLEGSTRRYLTFLLVGFTLATSIRTFLFSHLAFGPYLVKNLAPVERETVRWGYILGVRIYDLILGSYIWKHVDGRLTKDGALFGVLVITLSRISLYAFEHSYFLLSAETISTILFTDILSLGTAFSLLPTFFPHSTPSHRSLTPFERMDRNRELLINVILAYTLSTVVGGFFSFVIEKLGGYKGVVEEVYEIVVPSILSADSLSTAEMMRHPLISIPLLRSTLSQMNGLPMQSHLGHSFLTSLLSIPLSLILPRLPSLHLSLLTILLIFPTSLILLWDILPLSIYGSTLISLVLALRGALTTFITSFILEELRLTRYIESVNVLLVDEKTGEVLKTLVEEVEIEEGALERGEGVLEGELALDVELVGKGVGAVRGREGGLRSRKGGKVAL